MSSEPDVDSQPDPKEQAHAELGRLREKRSATKDKDIRSALDMRIGQILGEFGEPLPLEEAAEEPQAEPEVDEAVEPPTPEQLEAAEGHIRQARVEKMRGNKVAATEQLELATKAAPGSAIILEALGDDLIERRQYRAAKETYAKAVKVDPTNVALERKYAEVVLRSANAGSIEDQLRRGMGDSLLPTMGDTMAGNAAARWLSAFFPGAGQLVIGQTQKGATLLSIWVISFIGIVVLREDFKALLKFAVGGRAHPNLFVMVPLLAMMVTWIVSLAGLANTREVSRTSVHHPKPPVDLPFE